MSRKCIVRSLTIVWVLLLGAVLAGAGTQSAAPQEKSAGDAAVSGQAGASGAARKAEQHSAGQKLAEEQFKNIQVLKGIPADQLIPAMQFIAASLGVECEYCHDHQAMDNDDKKPKKIARKMMTMMFDIDKANFDGRLEVTCYSCHRGAAKPVSVPVIHMEEEPAGKEALQSAARPPQASELFDKYLAAVGGATALGKITSRVQTGKLEAFGGKSFPADVYTKAPGKRISVMHLQGGDSVTAFDGRQGWLSVPGRPAHPMSAAENDAAKLDADLQFPVHVKSLYPKFTVSESEEKIDGREAYLVRGVEEGRPPLQLYFDKQTGLLLRLVRYAQSPLGLNPTQIDYADYREADGVKVPFRWTMSRAANRFTIQVEQMQQNVPVDDAKFTAPPPPPQPSGPQPPAAQKPPSN